MEGLTTPPSLTFDEFKLMTSGIEIELALGSGEERIISQGEMINRENLSKNPVASRSLSQGDIITASDMG